MNELPINIKSIIDKLPDFQNKLLYLIEYDNDNIYILYNIITEIYEINTEKYKKEKFNKLSNFINLLKSYGLLKKNIYEIFKDDIIKQLTSDNFYESNNDVINYIFYYIEKQIKEINSKDSDKLNEIVNDNIDINEKDFEKTDEEDYEEDFEDDFEEKDEEITENIKDTTTKINDVLYFLKDLCSILKGFILNNASLKQLRINIIRLNSSIITTIINTKSNLELLKLFIGMDINIITLFKNFISDETNQKLLKIYLTSYKDITKEDIIEVLNKFIKREIKAGKKKKKGKRILKKYKK